MSVYSMPAHASAVYQTSCIVVLSDMFECIWCRKIKSVLSAVQAKQDVACKNIHSCISLHDLCLINNINILNLRSYLIH